MGEHEIDSDATVRDVIVELLLESLPPELRVSAPSLADRVLERPSVARHAEKRWGELSEGEGDTIAREVGLFGRCVIEGVSNTSPSSPAKRSS